MPSSTPVVLGAAGRRAGYAQLAAGILLITVLVRLHAYGGVWIPLLLTGYTAWLLLVRSGDLVRLQDDALVVVAAGRERRYPWSDILEVSWRSQVVGPGPVLRVRGGSFDKPGPNLPEQVARLPIFGQTAVQAATTALRAAAQQHGVRYDQSMERDIARGKRRPRVPGEDEPQR